MIRCDFSVLSFSVNYLYSAVNYNNNDIFHLSMKSKSIKLLVTNNNSHRNSATINDHIQNVHQPVHEFENHSGSPSSP